MAFQVELAFEGAVDRLDDLAQWPEEAGPRRCGLAFAGRAALAGELREAVAAESPERVERVLIDWQAVAAGRAGTRST